MAQSCMQSFSTASVCHKINFVFGSPLSLLVLVGVAIVTASTRNLATLMLKDLFDGLEALVCSNPQGAEAIRQMRQSIEKLDAFKQFDTIFKTYVTAFGGGVIAFHIVMIQLFHCCSMFKRSRVAHICGVIWATIGFIIFVALGLTILAALQQLDLLLDCQKFKTNPYKLSAEFCTNPSSFKPADYFATIICGRVRPALEAWAALMFVLCITGIAASFSGCCLNGCCNCAESFNPKQPQGQEMAAVSYGVQVPPPAFVPGYTSQNPLPPPQQYAPQQYAPQQLAPPQLASQQYAPQQYAPQQYAPQQYAPQQYAPQQYDPQQYAPQQYAATVPQQQISKNVV